MSFYQLIKRAIIIKLTFLVLQSRHPVDSSSQECARVQARFDLDLGQARHGRAQEAVQGRWRSLWCGNGRPGWPSDRQEGHRRSREGRRCKEGRVEEEPCFFEIQTIDSQRERNGKAGVKGCMYYNKTVRITFLFSCSWYQLLRPRAGQR